MYMRKLKIAAGVVLFNPENIDRLKILLNKLEQQFDKVYIFNNGDDISLSINFNKIHYINKKENMGIAFALNTIMEYAKNDGYSWVVSMDQDSLIPDGLIDGFVSAIKTYEKIGIVCPQVVDKRRIFSDIKKNKNHEFVDFCITSASCTSIEAWEMCGKYDEWMFIDLVDNDFCKRLTITGYKILQLNEWVLDQEFGKIVPKNKKKQIFWFKISKLFRNENIAKLSYKKYVSPMRVYYTNRNIIYLNRKLCLYGNVGYRNYNCKGYLGFVFSFIIPSILRSQNKFLVTKLTLRGIKDGLKEKTELWEARNNEV